MLTTRNLQNKSAYSFINETTDRVHDTCLPFFQAFNLTQFAYMRIYDNGKIFRLVSHKEWSKTFLEKEFYNDPNFLRKEMFNLQLGSYQCRTLVGAPQGIHWNTLYNSQIWNVLIYYKKKKNFLECCCLGTTPENNQVINLYMNNFKDLYNFFLYFKEKNIDLINDSDQQKLLISTINPQDKPDAMLEKDRFSQILQSHKHTLQVGNQNALLTQRQFEVLSQLSLGKTAKEIGRNLQLSPRTIEHYINELKVKLPTNRKDELVKALINKRMEEHKKSSLSLLRATKEVYDGEG